jgi:hypothetical protein
MTWVDDEQFGIGTPGASPTTVNHIVVFNFYNVDISK